MNDGFNKPSHEESNEFEDFENAQPSGQPKPQTSDGQSTVTDKFDIKDEVGKAIETVTSSLFGSTDPAVIQQEEVEKSKQKQEDEAKLANVKNFLAQMAEDEQRFRQQKEEEARKKAEAEQEEEVEKQKEDIKDKDKEQSFVQQHILAEQSKAERKGGVGG